MYVTARVSGDWVWFITTLPEDNYVSGPYPTHDQFRRAIAALWTFPEATSRYGGLKVPAGMLTRSSPRMTVTVVDAEVATP